MQNKLNGLFKGISAEQLRNKLDNHTPLFLLDVRNQGEFEMINLGLGEKHIPLEQLRDRLTELPADKNAEIIVWCKISLRGYEAARVLMANGYTNVKVLEGGINAWPF
jgi:rhodanese-related sulfurtransferase